MPTYRALRALVPSDVPRPRRLFFTGAVDNDWANLGNWAENASGSRAAIRLPISIDRVVSYVSITTNSGSPIQVASLSLYGAGVLSVPAQVTRLARFGGTASNNSTVTGPTRFIDAAANNGTVTGDAEFEQDAVNGATGSVTGAASFSGTSDCRNNGSVAGAVTFAAAARNYSAITGNPSFPDSTQNHGAITGNPTFTGTARNHGTITGNPTFTATSINACGNVSGGVINGNPTFTGGFNQGTITGDPTFANNVGNFGSVSSNNTGAINGNPIFSGNFVNAGSVVGNPTFNGAALNNSGATITGVATFNDNSTRNRGTITGSATFNNASRNDGGGIINGNATFNSTAQNSGTGTRVNGNAVFNTSAQNTSNAVVSGNAVFNTSAQNTSNAVVSGNATFNNDSTNNSRVDGDATFPRFTAVAGVVTTAFPTARLNGNVGGVTRDGSNNVITAWVLTSGNVTSAVITGDLTLAAGMTISNTTVFGNVICNSVNNFSNNTINGNATFNDTVAGASVINGNATFNGSSFSTSTVNGNATFTAAAYSRSPVNTVSGTVTFTSATPVAFTLNNWEWSANSSNWVFTTAGQNWTFNGSSTVTSSATINGPATFNNTARLNGGTINGPATFNATAQFTGGTITGLTTFNTSAVNNATITSGSGLVFNNNTINFGVVSVAGTFNDSAINRGTVGTGSVFGNQALNSTGAVVSGGATFNTSAANYGFVTGSGTFNGSACQSGTVIGAIVGTPAACAGTEFTRTLLLNFNGANDSTTFTDSSPNAFEFTRVGDARLSTAQIKFGTASGFFDGTGDYIESTLANAAFNIQTLTTLTLEAWVYPLTQNTTRGLFGVHTNFSDGLTNVFIDNQNRLSISRIGINNITATGATVPINTWTHVVVAKAAGVTRLFINGILRASGTTNVWLSSTTPKWRIGYMHPNNGSMFNGYIDDFRFVPAVVYSNGVDIIGQQSFTPPPAQLK